MLPGVLSGQYPVELMELDLVRLCASAGARLLLGEVVGLDVDGRRVLLRGRPPVPFDVLSVGIGSVPSWAGVAAIDPSHVVTIKPMQTFLSRLDARLDALRADAANTLDGAGPAAVLDDAEPALASRTGAATPRAPGAPIRVVVVGAGAGGVEIALGLSHRVRARLGADVAVDVAIVSADAQFVPGVRASTAARIGRKLAARQIRTIRGRVEGVDGGRLMLAGGQTIEADVIVWATGAAPPPLVADLGLPTNAQGFLSTEDTLRSTAGAPIFAVGDCGSIRGSTTAKAGVYAVRQGPVLWTNIQRLLTRDTRPLESYTPQRHFLKLLNTADGEAIGEWHGVSFEGAWAWRLKDTIDRRFMRRLQELTAGAGGSMTARDLSSASSREEEMRCLGCGGKVSGSVLSRVLARLDVPAHERVLLGLDAPDDAALVRSGGHGDPLVVTVDAFVAPLDDPYLVGRIAVLNAASDVFAMGATPWAAFAVVTLPVGSSRQQEEMLHQLMAGALDELRAMGATLAGGHTIEGPSLAVGFTVLGSPGPTGPVTKGGLRPGDKLVLTKPLGTGVLLAAHMRARCRAAWWGPLVETMSTSNGPASRVALAHGVSGLTDVTGFGLAGHLLEMAKASGAVVRVRLDTVPLLPGAAELLTEGIESTLAPANRDAEAACRVAAVALRSSPPYSALFDPQTGGGLLMGVAPARVESLLVGLRDTGLAHASVIGDVIDSGLEASEILVEP